MDWLNEYMEAMARLIIDHEGVINKYIGDAIMAVFGIPLPRTNEAEIRRDAVKAAECACLERTARQSQNAPFRAKFRKGKKTGGNHPASFCILWAIPTPTRF